MKTPTYNEQQKMIADAIASFPPEFGLRAFQGARFMIDQSASFWSSSEGLLLYTFIQQEENGEKVWRAFGKGTPEELRRNIVLLEDDHFPRLMAANGTFESLLQELTQELIGLNIGQRAEQLLTALSIKAKR